MPARSHAHLLTESGVPTGLARDIYTQGDCWILAFELGLLLNAPLLALVSNDSPHAWDHVVVDLGRETVLDVEGRATRDEITSRWSRNACTPLVLRELGHHTSMNDYVLMLDGIPLSACVATEEDRELAQAMARTLVSLHVTPQEVS